jgi:hypothetical protein
MHILVARHAILRQPEKRSRRIFHPDERPLVANHVHVGVAFFASDARMFAFQVVACQPMVKLLLRSVPVDQIEILAVVLQMAANAVLPVCIAHLNLEVIPVFAAEPSRDFLVAIQALEGWRIGAELVAARALRGSGKRLMRF